MTNQKITELNNLATPNTADVLPIVSISANETDKITVANLVKDSVLSTSDITTNDVSTTKHGFVPKAPNDTSKFLRGDGTWATGSSATITISTSQTPSVATTAGQKLTITSKGYITIPSGASPSEVTVNMKIDGSTVDTVSASMNTNDGNAQKAPICLQYYAIPGAVTNNITFDQTIGNLVTIMRIE